VRCASWLDAGKRFVTADHDGVIHVWDASKRKVATSATGKGVWSLAVSPDEQIIACGGSDRRVHLRRAVDLELVASLEPQHGHLIEGLAFSPDGATLLSASRDDTLAVWNVPGRELVGRLEGHKAEVLVVRCLPDGRAVSGGIDGRLLVWDVGTGQSRELASGKPIHDIAVAGGVLITATDDGVRFLDA
jgi:WD40 repeat protein